MAVKSDPKDVPTKGPLPPALLRPSPLLTRLCKWLSTLAGTDQLMMLIQYTLDIVTHHLDHNTFERLRVILASHFHVLTSFPSKVPISPSLLSTRLKTLSAKISDTRILLRLHGIFSAYQFLISTYTTPSSNPTIAKIAKIQAYSNLLYYPLENAAYLASHSILPIDKTTETALWLWSCRFWGAYVVLDILRLHKQRDEYTDKRKWWAEMIQNLAYAPLTIHWSLEKGLGLRDVDVGYLGVVAGIASIYLGFPSS